jgi:hypothetical protein
VADPVVSGHARAPFRSTRCGRTPCRLCDSTQMRPRGRAAITPSVGSRHRDITCRTRTPATPGAMPQRTLAASSRADRARPALRDAIRAHRRRQSANGPAGLAPMDAARRLHDGVHRAPNRSGRDAARFWWGGAGARP